MREILCNNYEIKTFFNMINLIGTHIELTEDEYGSILSIYIIQR